MPDASILSVLLALIADRKANPPPERSYVVSLLNGGTADEPGPAGREHLVHEVADLLFHTLVLLGLKEIPWSEIEAELARRFGVSGIVEKESRGQF
jgi:phosphoribosyl-ATP pyrophosphohydrolase